MQTIRETKGFQSNQFRNLSSWRQDDVKLRAGQVETVTFLDTKPNMFLLVNYNSVTLYAGIQRVPSVDVYEARIEKNGPTTFGRPTPTGQVYLYNPGSTDVTVSLYSIYDEFDINIMKPVTIQMEGAEVQQSTLISGFSNGVSLPAGNNKLGAVDITGTGLTTLGEIVTALGRLVNNDVVVGYTNLQEVLQAVQGLGNAVTLADLSHKLDEIKAYIPTGGEQSLKDLYYNEAEAVTVDTTVDFTGVDNRPDKIIYLTNDGENDLKIKVYTDEAKTESVARTFTLKGGESLNGLTIGMYQMIIGPKKESELVTWRLLGGKF